MTAPFRDLFVELPRTVFESLQAIGEAAVAKAQRPAPLRESPRWLTWFEPVTRALAEYYGWSEILRTERDPLDHYITLVVRSGCRHAQRFRFDEMSMLRAATSASRIDLVCDIIERTERTCQCTRRPTHAEWSR